MTHRQLRRDGLMARPLPAVWQPSCAPAPAPAPAAPAVGSGPPAFKSATYRGAVGVQTAGIRWYTAITATQQLAVLTHQLAQDRELGAHCTVALPLLTRCDRNAGNDTRRHRHRHIQSPTVRPQCIIAECAFVQTSGTACGTAPSHPHLTHSPPLGPCLFSRYTCTPAHP
jgi:hypothetical protein